MRYPKDAAALLVDSVFGQEWYYSFELLPGIFTKGYLQRNFGLTRKLLSRIELRGHSLLDIGTMEGAVPVLAKRQGAGAVVGVDVAPFHEKVALVQHYTGASFEYRFGLLHSTMQAALAADGYRAFDVVVLSGVLYHCFGPLNTLAYARSMLRTGGLMIIETWGAIGDEPVMHFNKEGRFSADPSTYFLISTGMLDYVLRYLALEPIDVMYGLPARIAGHDTARIACVCRALPRAQGDVWMERGTQIVDYVTLIDWANIRDAGTTSIGYKGGREKVGVHTAVTSSRPAHLTDEDAVIRLDNMT